MVRRDVAGIDQEVAYDLAAGPVWKRNSTRAGVAPGLARTTRVSKNEPVAPSAR